MDYTIHVNDTPEKEDFMLVIIIDDKHQTEASFALSRTEKESTKLKLIKSAIAKVKFLNDNKIDTAKKTTVQEVLKQAEKSQKKAKKLAKK